MPQPQKPKEEDHPLAKALANAKRALETQYRPEDNLNHAERLILEQLLKDPWGPQTPRGSKPIPSTPEEVLPRTSDMKPPPRNFSFFI